MRFIAYMDGIVVSVSIMLNAILGGEPPETLSYRSAKARADGRRWGCILCRALDALDPDHCKRTLEWWTRYRSTHKLEGFDRDVS